MLDLTIYNHYNVPILNETEEFSSLMYLIVTTYRDIWKSSNSIPELINLYVSIVARIYNEKFEEVVSFYKKYGYYEDLNRVIEEGLCKEDLESIGSEIDFNEFDIMFYLDSAKYVYFYKGKYHNLAQKNILE